MDSGFNLFPHGEQAKGYNVGVDGHNALCSSRVLTDTHTDRDSAHVIVCVLMAGSALFASECDQI